MGARSKPTVMRVAEFYHSYRLIVLLTRSGHIINPVKIDKTFPKLTMQRVLN